MVGVVFNYCFGVYSWSWLTFIFYYSLDSDFLIWLNFGVFLFYFWGPYALFLGSGQGSKTVLGSTHVVKHFLFSIVPSILSFDFNLIFWLFLNFCGPNGLFLGSMFKNCFCVSSHIVEQLSFSMLPWILTFEFDLIFFVFLGP